MSLSYTSSSSGVVVASRVGHIAPSGSVVATIVYVLNPVLVVRQPMPERVQEAYDFMANLKLKLSYMLDMERVDMLAHQLRMAKYAEIITEWRSTTVAKERAPRESARITKKNIFGLPCIAIGRKAMTILKAK